MESEPTKPKCHCVCRKFVAAIVVLLIIGAVCCHVHRPRSHWGGPKPGAFCIVYLNGEFVDGDTHTSTYGKLVAVKRDAILLRTHVESAINSEKFIYQWIWIPKSNILLIKYTEE